MLLWLSLELGILCVLCLLAQIQCYQLSWMISHSPGSEIPTQTFVITCETWLSWQIKHQIFWVVWANFTVNIENKTKAWLEGCFMHSSSSESVIMLSRNLITIMFLVLSRPIEWLVALQSIAYFVKILVIIDNYMPLINTLNRQLIALDMYIYI